MKTGRQEHDPALDFLKGCSIILVVFFHNIQLNPDGIVDNVLMMLGNCAVPCFFLVSGALFFSRPFSMEKHLRRIVQFYAAAVCWRAIYLFLFRRWQLPGKAELLSYLFLFQSLDGVLTAHFWFMDAMLTVLLAAPLLRICVKEHRELLPYLMGILLIFNQLLADGNLLLDMAERLAGRELWDISAFAEISPFSFRYSNYMFYYLLGALLYERRETPEDRRSCLAAAAMVAGGLAVLVLIKYFQSGTFRWAGTHLVSGYYWLSTAVIASGLFILVRKIPYGSCPPARLFAGTVGSCTMGVFYMHIPLIVLFTNHLYSHISMYNGWILNLAESLLITGISCAVTLVLRRIPIAGKLVG